ncbi:MAG: DJ-1 family protein [Desulfobulbus propionicus]|nr:MAG: DJ-1 family protein [Desulfobulbus propionicus]
MKKKVLVPLADGTEMIEALSVVDVFRRAGIEVDTASVNELVITSSHGVKIEADKLIGDCLDTEYDLVVIPGGIPGAENMRESADLVHILKKQKQAHKMYGAICAAPAVVLEQIGLLEGKTATCHPLFVADLDSNRFSEDKVVVDGLCVTSRGAGTAVDFALTLLGLVAGEETKQNVAQGMAL